MVRLSIALPLAALLALGYSSAGSSANNALQRAHDCDENGSLCTETLDSIGYNGAYTGHDEPSLLFYSNKPGSGNEQTWIMRLPKDPPTFPTQDGTGGTFNFQLHPAFWVGMAICDDQSAPNPGGSASAGPNIPCTPNSDVNIFEGLSLAGADYVGKHPGVAFMEMQFYPPSWSSGCNSSDHPTQWCSALNIDSLSENMNTGALNNNACRGTVGDEYVNFQFITRSGVPESPSALVGTPGSTNFHPDKDQTLFYNSGDVLSIALADTAHGLQITITDLTTGQQGSMVASAANGFAQVTFDPTAGACTTPTVDFHPMYATSSENTRVTWAAHTYNIAFSDEIGHFEFCNAIDALGNCTVPGVQDNVTGLDGDDDVCFDTTNNIVGFVPLIGCLDTDVDFDGVPYRLVWPGTDRSVGHDRAVHPEPVQFNSPVFTDANGARQNYERVAFEADLPRIEFATSPPCQRHVANPSDPSPGTGCVNPPVGADFYPIFTTRGGGAACEWQLGGAFLPGTTNSFGGNSAAEYGPLLQSAYPAANGMVSLRYNNFRRVLPSNPCPTR